MSAINSIKAIILLGIDGRRSIAQYYDEQLASTWKQFEKKLFAKTKTPRAKESILILDGMQILHKFSKQNHIYVVGSKNENPLLLDSVLSCLVEVTTSNALCQEDFWSRIVLALDEICDSGIVLEMDPNLVIQRVTSTNSNDLENIAQRTARLLGIQ